MCGGAGGRDPAEDSPQGRPSRGAGGRRGPDDRDDTAEPAGQAAVPRLTAPDHANFAYLPFGGGRRACIGQSFAELEMALVLAAITQNYRLDLTAGGMPEPVAGITLRPAQGLPMRLVRR